MLNSFHGRKHLIKSTFINLPYGGSQFERIFVKEECLTIKTW